MSSQGVPLSEAYNQQRAQKMQHAFSYLLYNDYSWGSTAQNVLYDAGLVQCKMKVPQPCEQSPGLMAKQYENYCSLPKDKC